MIFTCTPELLAALSLFAFASAITPGPNNSLLMASLYPLVNELGR
jgi:hypothetical protein